jgi:hypothetical protein
MQPMTAFAPAVRVLADGATSLVPRYVAVAASASGDNTVIAAVAGRRIVVLCGKLMANGTVNSKWKSGASTDITGLEYLIANDGYVLPFAQCGWFATATGEALVLNLSGAIAVGGHLTYVLVEP